jgi:hypothetical protein
VRPAPSGAYYLRVRPLFRSRFLAFFNSLCCIDQLTVLSLCCAWFFLQGNTINGAKGTQVANDITLIEQLTKADTTVRLPLASHDI